MTDRPLVAGVDTSTQSCKVVVCDAETGEVVRTGRASHPDGTEVDPRHWWAAWQEASGGGLLDGVSAVAVGGQQHGMVLLDEHGEVVRDALLWNDTRSAQAAARPRRRARRPGLGRRHRPGARRRDHGEQAALGRHPRAREPGPGPHLRAPPRLAHRPHPRRRRHRPRRLDDRRWRRLRHRLLVRGHPRVPPRPAPARDRHRPRRAARGGAGRGRRPHGIRAGGGRGHRRQHGRRAGPRASARATSSSRSAPAARRSRATRARRPTPPAACSRSRMPRAVSSRWSARSTPRGCSRPAPPMLGTDHAGLDRLALAGAPGAGGLTLLPYLDGERTPNLPTATGSLHGLTRVERDAGEPGPRGGRGDAAQPRRRGGCRARRRVPGAAGAAHRRCRGVDRGAGDRARPVRGARRGAEPRRVRRRRCGPPGGLGARRWRRTRRAGTSTST